MEVHLKKIVIALVSALSVFFLFGCAQISSLNTDHINFSKLTVDRVKRVYIVAYGSRYRDTLTLAELTYDDIDSLIPLLNQVELTGELTEEFKDVPAMYWYMYRIELYNGQEFDFAANKNYYVLNMQGYAAEEETGNQILLQYRELCKKYFPED